MKSFILICLFTLNAASAATLAKFRSSPDGTSSQKFLLEGEAPKFEKTSNLFDPKSKDYRIGVHSLAGKPAEFKKLMAKVDEYAKKFKEVDEFLKTKNSSFNDVAGAVHHDSVILVDEFRIKPESKYYAELDQIFKKLQGMNWRLKTGFKLTENLEKVLEYKDGKEVKSSPYARDLYCQKAHPPTVCTFYGGGQVFVQ